MRLSVDGLACRRGGRLVLDGLSLVLGPGEALVVTGRNGAGKSTLLAALAGLLKPERGTIAVLDTGEPDPAPAEHLHLVGHRDGLKSALSARENLLFAQALLGRPGLAPEAALAAFGLAGALDRPVGLLSAGQRRRVALARLLVARRPLWLLDEPTTALDAAATARLAALLAEHREGGGLVIAATHAALDLPDARPLVLGEAA